MSHGIDVIEEPLRSLPEVVVVAAAMVTRFGDTWFVLVLVAGLYLLADRAPLPVSGVDRREGAVLLGLVFAALAAVMGLKAAFAHPRPPGADTPPALALLPRWLRAELAPVATTDGYAFPSGHALQSTVVYGGLALAGEAERRRRRVLAAAGLVGLIAISRVILGVHYLLDVVGGVVAGGILLGTVWYVAATRPERALLIAVAVALGAVLVAGFALPPLAVLGGAIGARLAWGVVGGDVPAGPAGRREVRQLVAFGAPVVLALLALTVAMELDPEQVGAVVAGFLAGGVIVAALVAVPVAVGSASSG